MHLKLTLHRAQGRTTNVSVTVDATALVGDLARALYSNDPVRAGSEATVPPDLTLRVQSRFGDGESGSTLDPQRNLTEAGLRSGSVVAITRHTHRSVGVGRGPTAALLRIVSGPEQGREIALPAGISSIGRSADCDVVLRDSMVSKRHCRVLVGESIEIVDANSVNGIVMGGRRVQRAQVGPTDQVVLGDSLLTFTQTKLAGTVEPTSSAVEFNRSPRVVARFDEQSFDPPALPKVMEPQRFPIVSMVAPLVMGMVLFAVTRSLLSIVFIGLSPMMMLGVWLDGRYQSKKRLEREIANFEAELVALQQEIVVEKQLERAVRLSRTPSVAEVLTSVHRLASPMWSYRPEHDAFLTVRLGLGTVRSFCTLESSGSSDGIAEYRGRIRDYKRVVDIIDHVPLIGDFRTAGTIGVAGRRGVVEGVARGLVLQLVGLHSPAELVLAVMASPSTCPVWEWAEWLPHTGSVHSPISGAHLAGNPGTGSALLTQLEDVIASRGSERPGAPQEWGSVDGEDGSSVLAEHDRPILPAIVVVVEDDAPVDRARLTRLAELGPDVNVHVLWVASQLESLPSVCRTFILVEVDSNGATVGQVRHGVHSHPVQCESVDEQSAQAAALFLAPVVDSGVAVDDASDLPPAISWLDLVGLDIAEESGAVLEGWRLDGSLTERDGDGVPLPDQDRRKAGDLRAMIGSLGAGALALDLREQGPHALVGGTTGSGKSEFLQTWVLGMAAAHSPDRVTFLFVDYKGGAAFADCVDLPHTVGLVTDLSQHLVRRALTSLRAEIHFRERLLNRKKAKDLISLEKTGDPECPPSLIIIVDEFAALVQEVPEFVDGVVDVAQRGRSLGLHLILATQRPAGVVKDNLRANTNLRIALRMADAEDSSDVIGVPDAAHFPTNMPGRAAVRTGPGRLTAFQAGYAGGRTTEVPEAPPISISEMQFGARVHWDEPLPEGQVEEDLRPTDIVRTVSTIRAAAEAGRIPAARKPWLPVLEEAYGVRQLNPPGQGSSDNRLLLGVADDPQNQAQPTLYYDPDVDGNLAIFGAGGSGKSATLRQIAIASAITVSGGPVHCYGLDFGSAGLKLIEPLPHVGAVISGDDEERIGRLMRRLVELIDTRSELYAQANASNITEYRKRAGQPDEPRIMVLVDGIGAFREAYELSTLSPWFSLFTQIATDGRSVGVHVVISADRPTAVTASLGSTIGRRIVLRLAGPDDYMMLDVPKDILDATSPPGRGIIGDLEVQIAMIGSDANVAVQAREVQALSTAMRRRGADVAPTIEALPSEIELSSLVEYVGRTADSEPMPAFAVSDRSLEPIGFPPTGAFLLSGPPGSGRTTALHTMAQAVRRATPTRNRVLLAPRRTPLADREQWTEKAVGSEAVGALVGQISEAVRSGQVEPGSISVFIDSVTAFTSTPVENDLVEMIRLLGLDGHLIVGESEHSTWSQAWSLAGPFKSARQGLLLVPNDGDGDTLLATALGRIRRSDFPPGRGFLVGPGGAQKVQVAMPS
ncbi:FtsK/SpoIIIE domain-containing protein [Rhodococcus sp. IEGM 1379]|uniref:FtsK/SpoIIIE domain-containing protein n=1 Tax=Rhodococcus sp. IEGM 1379 TaxID=3047086 RepID=UPI0024B85C85|nr:FtsK/SpoIIIE domain-containing protein [Rhodococcus sp. IEGM 1379]MDI9914251.1 FtsK/SpoIIIE domain-containing protein [Rhodococcus sp. IEGM 1379]